MALAKKSYFSGWLAGQMMAGRMAYSDNNVTLTSELNVLPTHSLNLYHPLLSKPQPNLNTTVGFDMKMTLHTPPGLISLETCKQARELKFGTETHQTNLIKIAY